MSEGISGVVARWVARLAEVDGQALSDPERIDLLAALEGLKGAAAAAQARVTVAFAASQRDALTATLTATPTNGSTDPRDPGGPGGLRGRDRARSVERMIQRSVGSQVALARRVSPRQGSRHLGLARALVEELPETMAALTAGQTSEWRATLVAEQTACLSREDRTRVDAELATRPGGIPAMGDRRIASEARRIGYRLDPTAVLRRTQRATSQRCVTLRPAPEAMTWLTALLPVASGVAAHAALTRAADTARAHGDPRTRGLNRPRFSDWRVLPTAVAVRG